MKRIINMLLVIVVTMQVNAQQSNFDTKYLKEHNLYEFDDDLKLTRANIFADYKSEFGLTANDEMRIERTIVEGEDFHTKFVQFHKGYQVENMLMNANGQNGVILNMIGEIAKNINVNTTITVQEPQALSIALEKIGATLYPWQDLIREKNLKEDSEDPTATTYPKGKLVIVHRTGSNIPENTAYCLAWKFQIQAINPYSNNTVYINANDGSIIFNLNSVNEYSYNSSGTGWTWYNGQFGNLETEKCNNCIKYRLKSSNNIETWDFNNGRIYPDDNNNWVENSSYGYTQRKSAASAHWAFQNAKHYYAYRFGRNGSDYNGKMLKAWMRTDGTTLAAYMADDDNNDAIGIHSDETQLAEGSMAYSKASFDILAHEYTHAMIKVHNY